MNTFDTANTIRDLIDYYCMRCDVGLDNCNRMYPYQAR